MRMFPIVTHNFHHALDNVFVGNFNAEFPATVETARREINGADDQAFAIDQHHFRVQLQMLQFMYFDAYVLQGAQASDALG